MSKFTTEKLNEIVETDHVQCGDASALARELLALRERAEPVVVPDLHKVVYHFRDLNEGFPVERFKADYVIAWMLANYPPAPPAPVVNSNVRRICKKCSASIVGYSVDGLCEDCYLAAPGVPKIDRKAICNKAHWLCARSPGATFYNAAEYALDEVMELLAPPAPAVAEPVSQPYKLPGKEQ
ncbi:hypothetical protein SM094_002477 [Cronobacter malonaticus]|nr:hypothetical protein [Cronobacter malonaticus]